MKVRDHTTTGNAAVFRHYEKLLKKGYRNYGDVPSSCRKCKFYSPQFRYRTCVYTSCPYGKKGDVFKKAKAGKNASPKKESLMKGRV